MSTIEWAEHPGCRVLRITTDGLALAFLPDLGGRLISLQHQHAELLWRNPTLLDEHLHPVRPRADWPELDGTMGSWANIGGSKTWPAPQGWSGPHEWAGPPDPVLDSGTWSTEISQTEDNVTVTFTSPPDERTGLTLRRCFIVPEVGGDFTELITSTASAGREVRWSAWEVAQVDTSMLAGGHSTHPDVGIMVSVAGDAPVRHLVEAVGRIEVSPVWCGTRKVAVTDVVAKIGIVDASGHLAFRRPDGVGLELSFEVEDDAVYPDGGSRVELWMQHPVALPLADLGGLHPDAHLVELEVLSPLRTIPSGESIDFTIRWSVSMRRM